MKYLLILVLLTSPAYAQSKVEIDKETQTKLGLKKSVEDTYMIYTFDEHKEVQKKLATLTTLKKKIPILKNQIDLQTSALKASKEVISSQEDTIKLLEARSTRLTAKYHKCLDDKASASSSLTPWIIAIVATAVALTSTGVTGYYLIKNK